MEKPLYSVSIRLRRLRTETAHVSVPITDALMRVDEKKLDTEKLLQAAIELGRLESTEWESDGEPEIEPHPIQTPPGKSAQ